MIEDNDLWYCYSWENGKCVRRPWNIAKDIIEGMKAVEAEMKERGLWHDKMTLEEMSNYAGKHVKINIKDKE